MRSTTSRRLRSRPPHRSSGLPRSAGGGGEDLLDVAHLVDQAARDEDAHIAVHVADAPDAPGERLLGLRPLEPGRHPFALLAGHVAPPSWRVFGLRVVGTVHHLESAQPSARSSTIFLVDRAAAECSLLRKGDAVSELPSRAQGTIPDLCRRVLGLPTDPPPGSSAALWTVAWFDAILAAWGDPQQRRGLAASWARLVALHPAVGRGPEGDCTPEQLVRLARAHADSWPWARLRGQREVAGVPGEPLSSEVAAWMDDGFFARWALGGFPPVAELVHDVAGLIDPDLRARLLRSVVELLR